jgi:hypothetical protein
LDELELSSPDALYDFDVTGAVRAWLADPGSNHGLLLRSQVSGSAVYHFGTSEDTALSNRPQLVILVSEPTATPQPTATATPNVVLQQGLAGYAGASDTYISQTDATANFASLVRLQIKGDGSYSSLLRFQLPDELRGCQVVEATLQLRTRYRDKVLPCTVGVYRILRPWVADQATWQNATSTQAWSYAGIWPSDCEPAAMSERSLVSSDEWYSFDVTPAVNAWLADPASNFGLLMMGNISGAVTYQFSSSEDSAQGYRPRLIVYCEPTPTPGGTTTPGGPTRTPTRTPGPTGFPRRCFLPIALRRHSVSSLQQPTWLWNERWLAR